MATDKYGLDAWLLGSAQVASFSAAMGHHKRQRHISPKLRRKQNRIKHKRTAAQLIRDGQKRAPQ
jgi:hypothetical protein